MSKESICDIMTLCLDSIGGSKTRYALQSAKQTRVYSSLQLGELVCKRGSLSTYDA